MKENYAAFATTNSTQNDHVQAKEVCTTRGQSEKNAIRICGHWSEQLSSKGKIYFYNCVTEVSQWQKPSEWSLPDMNKKELLEKKDSEVSVLKRSHVVSNTDNSIKENSVQPTESPSKRAKYSSSLQRPCTSDTLVSQRQTTLNCTSTSQFSHPYGTQRLTHSLENQQLRRNNDTNYQHDNSKAAQAPNHRNNNTPSAKSEQICLNGNARCSNTDDMDISPGSSPLSGGSSGSQQNSTWQYKRHAFKESSPHSLKHVTSFQGSKRVKKDAAIESHNASSNLCRDAPTNVALRQLVDVLRESLGSILAQSPASSTAPPDCPTNRSNVDRISSSGTTQLSSSSDTHKKQPSKQAQEHSCESREFGNRQPCITLPSTPSSNCQRSSSHVSPSRNPTRPIKPAQSSGESVNNSRAKNFASTISALINLFGVGNQVGVPGAMNVAGVSTVSKESPSATMNVSSQSPAPSFSHHALSTRHPSSSASPLQPSPGTPLSTAAGQYQNTFPVVSSSNASFRPGVDVSCLMETHLRHPTNSASHTDTQEAFGTWQNISQHQPGGAFGSILTCKDRQILSHNKPVPSSCHDTNYTNTVRNADNDPSRNGHMVSPPVCAVPSTSISMLSHVSSGSTRVATGANRTKGAGLPSSNLNELVMVLHDAIQQNSLNTGNPVPTTQSSASRLALGSSTAVSTPGGISGARKYGAYLSPSTSRENFIPRPESTVPCNYPKSQLITSTGRLHNNGPQVSPAALDKQQLLSSQIVAGQTGYASQPRHAPLLSACSGTFADDRSPATSGQRMSPGAAGLCPPSRQLLPAPSQLSGSCSVKPASSEDPRGHMVSGALRQYPVPVGQMTTGQDHRRLSSGSAGDAAGAAGGGGTGVGGAADNCQLRDVVSLILDNAEMKRHVDQSLVHKFRDLAAEKHELEAEVEARKFDRLQSVLYSELSGELKKLRALVRISEAKLAIHRKKKTSLQELMDMLEAQAPLSKLSFSEDTL